MTDTANLPPEVPDKPEVRTISARNGEEVEEREDLCRELIVISEGSMSIERSDCEEPEFHVATDFVEIPQGVRRKIKIHQTPTHLVIIHPGTGRAK